MGYPSIDLVLAGGETHTFFVKGSNDGAVACMGNGGGEVSDDAMTVTGCKQRGRNPWAPICRIGYADAAPAAATGQSKAAPAEEAEHAAATPGKSIATGEKYVDSSNIEFGVAVTAKRAVRLTRFESMAAESPSEFYHVFHKKGDHRNVNSNTITGG